MDDKSKRGPADAKRISLTEDYEVRYWRKKFNCTAKQLSEAVAAVGHMAVDVGRFLASKV
jgi:hypothetical protein